MTNSLASFLESYIVIITLIFLIVYMNKSLQKILSILWVISLLYIWKTFLIPLAVGSFLWLILSYCIDRIEKKWVRSTWARIFVMIWFVIALVWIAYGLLATITYTQDNRESIREIFISSWEQILISITSKTPLSMERLNQWFTTLTDSITISSFEWIIWDTFSFFTHFILVIVYTLLIPIYKGKIILLLDYISKWKGASIYADTQYTVTKYTQWLFILMFIVAILYYIWLTIFWVPYAWLISVGSALMTLVPTVGTMLWWIWAIVASSLLTGSIKITISMLIRYIGIQFLEEYLILPFVVGKKVAMNVFTAIVAIVLWWLIRWVAWIFLAMPVVWVIQKFLHNKKHPLYKVFS